MSQILFFFGAIGVFNSIIVSIYFLTAKSRRTLSNVLFGLFLLALNLRVLKSLFYSFSTVEPIYFLQSGPAFFLLIGPLYLTYLMTCLEVKSFLLKYWKVHVLGWILVVLGLVIFIPFSENRTFNKVYLLPLINIQWLGYIALGGLLLKSKIRRFKSSPLLIKWLGLLSLAQLILWLAYFLIDFDYFITGSIIFSALFYTFFLFFTFNKKITSEVFKKAKRSIDLQPGSTSEKLVSDLLSLMETQKLYVNTNLKLPDLAQELEVSAHELSRLLNENIGMSFPDFINQYRVEAAKQLIQTNALYTIEAIGNQSGFKSKSAFYKAFKKFTGVTPAKYKAQL